jgi:hypothetical protein
MRDQQTIDMYTSMLRDGIRRLVPTSDIEGDLGDPDPDMLPLRDSKCCLECRKGKKIKN